ncbi:hypothetical protein [Pseudomonas sp. TWRC1-2]|uniref:hypothetical protein n=1 Tax=Pseudomonas sp. TWRC1-2 TaxID=2804628 RepID=UPI003CEB8498
MRKILHRQGPAKLRAADRRFARSIRANVGHLNKKGRRSEKRKLAEKPHIVDAPSKMDLYSPKNHRAFVLFLQRIRQCVSTTSKTVINLKNCSRITAGAGLLFFAEIDRLVKAFPQNSIRCINPENLRSGPGRSDNSNFVEGALNQIGFYRLIGQKNNTKSSVRSVKRWHQLSGDSADGSLASSLLQTLSKEVHPQILKQLYRGAIEAIANCVEHAYPSPRQDGLGIPDPRWWMLVGIDDENLTIIVCDLGVGIPSTLPAKHSDSFLSNLKSRLGITGSSDSEMIRASTHIKETRTKLKYRGKGGKDFRSMPETFTSSFLAIRSNKGSFFITGRDHQPFKAVSSRKYIPGTNNSESTIEHDESICGTLVEWAIQVKDLQK